MKDEPNKKSYATPSYYQNLIMTTINTATKSGYYANPFDTEFGVPFAFLKNNKHTNVKPNNPEPYAMPSYSREVFEAGIRVTTNVCMFTLPYTFIDRYVDIKQTLVTGKDTPRFNIAAALIKTSQSALIKNIVVANNKQFKELTNSGEEYSPESISKKNKYAQVSFVSGLMAGIETVFTNPFAVRKLLTNLDKMPDTKKMSKWDLYTKFQWLGFKENYARNFTSIGFYLIANDVFKPKIQPFSEQLFPTEKFGTLPSEVVATTTMGILAGYFNSVLTVLNKNRVALTEFNDGKLVTVSLRETIHHVQKNLGGMKTVVAKSGPLMAMHTILAYHILNLSDKLATNYILPAVLPEKNVESASVESASGNSQAMFKSVQAEEQSKTTMHSEEEHNLDSSAPTNNM